jgi:hypothetical protein
MVIMLSTMAPLLCLLFWQYVCLTVSIHAWLSVYLFDCQYVCSMTVWLLVYLFDYLYVCSMTVWLLVYLFDYLYVCSMTDS